MMDREAFERWCRREAERIEREAAACEHRVRRFASWGYYVAEMQERCAPPVSAEVEAFCREMQSRMGRGQ